MRSTASKLARNAFEVLSKLPRHGVGHKISRNSWEDNSFWAVTEAKLDLDGKHGKAFGVLTWRGQRQQDRPKRIPGTSKRVWRPLSGFDRSTEPVEKWASLVANALASEPKPSSESIAEAAEAEGPPSA